MISDSILNGFPSPSANLAFVVASANNEKNMEVSGIKVFETMEHPTLATFLSFAWNYRWIRDLNVNNTEKKQNK